MNGEEDIADLADDTCLDEAGKDWIARIILRNKIARESISYILTTANNRAGPIGEFQLVVSKPDNRYVLVCFDDIGREESPSQVLFPAKDFKPKEDLHIYYLY